MLSLMLQLICIIEVQLQLQSSAATRTLFLEEQKFVSGGAKIFGLVYFSPSSLLISKKKRSSRQFGLFFSEFYVDLKKIPKKSHYLETVARKRGVWVGMLGILGGQNFCLGGTAPFCPPRSFGPV